MRVNVGEFEHVARVVDFSIGTIGIFIGANNQAVPVAEGRFEGSEFVAAVWLLLHPIPLLGSVVG